MPHPPTDDAPHRVVTARLEADVTEVAELVLSLALAEGSGAVETLEISVDGRPLGADAVAAAHGTRLHLVRDVPVGHLVVDYRAEVTGWVSTEGSDAAGAAGDDVAGAVVTASGEGLGESGVGASGDDVDRILYLRPSRYCESDALGAVAADHFSGLAGKDLLDAVSSWVGRRLAYVVGSSRPTDGALQTYLSRQGVCRDYAHLVVALLRARGLPARLVSVYAPGLSPMDFHAVVEARLAEGWCVVDATLLAPRGGMLRIATGRDASDTAFLSVHSGRVTLTGLSVTATMHPDLPDDDVSRLVRLG